MYTGIYILRCKGFYLLLFIMNLNISLRKYPPVPRLERKAMVDYKIPNSELIIPKDVMVCIPTYSIQRDEEYFPDPEVFDPERFSNEEKNKRHPMAFQPFGHGPRNCIGKMMALFTDEIHNNSLLLLYAKTVLTINNAQFSQE